MTLPVIQTPTFELTVPSTKEVITYRPFLVKEEKILLLAMESEDEKQLQKALKQIVNNCTFKKINVDKVALFDLEYVFLRIRAKSVSEVAHIQVICPDDEETAVEVDIPLEEIEVEFAEDHTNNIKLNETVGVLLSYPQFEDVYKEKEGETPVEQTFRLIKQSISQVYDGETVYERVDFTDKELDKFLDSLTSSQFQSVGSFFDSMPKLKYDVQVTNPKTGVESTVTLEGLGSFFG